MYLRNDSQYTNNVNDLIFLVLVIWQQNLSVAMWYLATGVCSYVCIKQVARLTTSILTYRRCQGCSSHRILSRAVCVWVNLVKLFGKKTTADGVPWFERYGVVSCRAGVT